MPQAYAAAMTDLERRVQRMQRTRFWIRAEFAIAIAAVIITAFLLVAAPGCLCGGMFAPSIAERLLPWVGIGGLVVGFVAMIRLSRVHPESGERTWRYRD
jgi:hypothetical protein